MYKLLQRIYHSRLIRFIYHHSHTVRSMDSVLKGIYFGTGEVMTRKTCWRIYHILNYFRIGGVLFQKRHIRSMSLPIDEEVIYLNPERIEYALLTVDSSHKNTAPVEAGNWDLLRKKLDTIDTLAGPDGTAPLGEIKVGIDRHGAFLLADGMSQLAGARASGIDSIPVRVTKRHYQWARFRKEVFLCSQEGEKGAYQQATHPDFQHIRFHRREDRWDLILKNLPLHGGSVLDIGANWGYFCHKFEGLGFDCYAVENDYRCLYFLKKLRETENKRFEIIPGSVFDIERKSYDIVLALSVFHAFLRKKDTYDKLTRLLGELDMKIMYFEPRQTGQEREGDYISYREDEFVEYIIRNSCLHNYKLLGRNERGRNVYLLS